MSETRELGHRGVCMPAMPGGLYFIFQVMVNILEFKAGEDLSFNDQNSSM